MIQDNKIGSTNSLLVDDIKQILQKARSAAYASINASMIDAYWQIGRRIVEEEMQGKDRAEYGSRLIKSLSKELITDLGKEFNWRNLFYYKQFYVFFPNWQILNACVQNLTWTHLRMLLRVTDDNARLWYLNEASKEMWSTRTLDRNISSQYYYRLLQSPEKEAVKKEMLQMTAKLSQNKDAETFIKSPVVTEFLGLPSDNSFSESDLEKSIISHLERFIMELGKGYAFVARQQHISTDTEDYYIDLVFYNYILKCFIIIDLKTTKITHQDVGQMDMYIRMYDELKRTEGDNPTIGILLCSETSHDIARYSVLHDSKQLFATKYLTYLPTEEQLRKEIEQQKEIFLLQQKEINKE